MSTEQHLIENALFYYRRNESWDFDSDPLIKKQRNECGVILEVLQEFVEYIYYNVLETEEDRVRFFHDEEISQKTQNH